MVKNIEVYEPKKNIFEKAKDIPKKYLILVFAIILIICSISSTYYVFKANPDFAESVFGYTFDKEKENVREAKDTGTSTNDVIDRKISSQTDNSDNQDLESDKKTSEENKQAEEQQEFQPADYSTLKQDLLNSPFIKDLPEDGKIVLGFYNFHTGEREWEKHYILEKNSVKKGNTQERDMKIFMYSGYVSEFKNKDICDIIGEAKENGDLGIETEKSKTALTWKYKSMLDYKDCLGM